jgi:hypothetical protein
MDGAAAATRLIPLRAKGDIRQRAGFDIGPQRGAWTIRESPHPNSLGAR